jgi:acyl-CoA synthetase (AMP-forming)/AMP-acid ligase II
MSAASLAPSIEDACERWAARPAVTHHDRTLTYSELFERILALSSAYRSLGIRPGDRVVCQLPLCPEHLVAVGAAWRCGAIHVGAHRDLTEAELTALVERTQAAAVVFQPPAGLADPLGPLRAVRAARPSVTAIVHGHPAEGGEHSLTELIASSTAGSLPAASAPEDTALLLFTSGTTGRPKAVMETLPALWGKMQFFADALSPGPDDVHLMYLPINHVFGLKLTLMALMSGGRLVLLDQYSPEEALRLADDQRVTILPATPTHLTLLLRTLDDGHRLESLRWIVSAAAPLPAALVEETYDRLGVELMHVYGCSEGFLTVTTARDEIRGGSVGRAVFRGPPGTPPTGSVAILHPDRMEHLPREEVGEIAYGTSRPVRFWGEPARGADGWYRTGDLGRLDCDGRLTISGRLKEVVNRGGLKVACGEVEAVLTGHPGVAECAVIGTPDPVLGEAICACVVQSGEPSPILADVRAALRRRLARHKLPDELCVLDSLPRSAIGKLDRRALAALVVDADLPRERLRSRRPAGPDRSAERERPVAGADAQ